MEQVKVFRNKEIAVIKMSANVATRILHFGLDDGIIICDSCNNVVSFDDKCYYIPVLSRCLCKQCYDRFMEYARYYEEDSKYEKKQLTNYIDKLKLYYDKGLIDLIDETSKSA